MSVTPGIKIAVALTAWMTGITLLHYEPWRKPEVGSEPGRAKLTVGFLPVT
jgi:hypothetical protein